MILRVHAVIGVLYCIYLGGFRLLDGDNDAAGPDGASAFNVFKQRKFKLQPVQRICQRFPVVPQCELASESM